jgi:hypothetical protein
MVDTNLRMAVGFVLALGLMGILMKLAALLVPARTNGPRWLFLISPLVSPTSLDRSKPLDEVLHLLLKMLVAAGALLLVYLVYWRLRNRVELPALLGNYLKIPAVYLWGEVLGCCVGLCWSWSGRLLPVVQNGPLLARGIADFWSNRWNVWFSDWFRFVIFNRLRHRPIFALFAVFGLSGLMHEWVVNLPLYLVTGANLFGSMMAYFLLQAVGVLLERRISKTHVRLRVWFAWLVVLVPAPLVINEGLLRALQLWR